MKAVLAIVGILLIAAGVLSFAGVGLTTERTRIEVGPLEASVKEERVLPPVLAGGAIVAGLALLVVGARRSR
ncbi:MAG TPA: hypothetical protein VLE53_16205 [Gemmatimonadaceae bacterium]|nr:hypothetical protein [Gemmatimonadaceae bacterium]